MNADEIRGLVSTFKETGTSFDEGEGAELMITIMAELAAHTATIAGVLSKGNINVDAKVREGSHGH